VQNFNQIYTMKVFKKGGMYTSKSRVPYTGFEDSLVFLPGLMIVITQTKGTSKYFVTFHHVPQDVSYIGP